MARDTPRALTTWQTQKSASSHCPTGPNGQGALLDPPLAKATPSCAPRDKQRQRPGVPLFRLRRKWIAPTMIRFLVLQFCERK